MRHRNLVLIGLAAVCTMSLAACGTKEHALTPTERATAELGARQFAGNTADMVGVSGSDSDGDGYVTATLRNRAAPHDTLSVVCSYRDGAVGCKGK